MAEISLITEPDPRLEQLRVRRVPTADARQLRLSELWAFYEGNQYDSLKYDWDGRPVMAPVDKLQQTMLTIQPIGFIADPDPDVPWKQRRPVITEGLAKMIVDRFTALLFASHNRPTLRPEPSEAQEFIDAVLEQTDWWNIWRQARAFGGATGTVIVGVRLDEGQARLDVFDPRFTLVQFKAPDSTEIVWLEILYAYQTTENRTQIVDGKPIEVATTVQYYYRRVITPEMDVVFKPLESKAAEQVGIWEVDSVVEHNLGFVPAVWVQNLPAIHQTDGVCDFEGTQDMIVALDAQLSQAHVGILYNADPTLVLNTDKDASTIRKGSRHAIVLEQGGDAKYLELSAGGPNAALTLAEKLEDAIMQQAQVVLHPGQGQMTAEEVRRRYEAMYDKADVLRGQYGEAMQKVLRLIVQVANQATSQGLAVDLPQPYPESVEIEWPHYVKETATDKESVIRQVVMAVSAGLLPREYAAQQIAKQFGFEDMQEFMKQLQADEAKRALNPPTPNAMNPEGNQ